MRVLAVEAGPGTYSDADSVPVDMYLSGWAAKPTK